MRRGHRLLVLGASETGTGPQNAAVLDKNSGKLIKVLANQGGNDEVWFNPGDGLYFLAEGQNAAFEQLGIVSSSPIFVSQDIIVAPGGKRGVHTRLLPTRLGMRPICPFPTMPAATCVPLPTAASLSSVPTRPDGGFTAASERLQDSLVLI